MPTPRNINAVMVQAIVDNVANIVDMTDTSAHTPTGTWTTIRGTFSPRNTIPPPLPAGRVNTLDSNGVLGATHWDAEAVALAPPVTARQFSSEAGNGTRSREDTIRQAAWATHYAGTSRPDPTAILRAQGISRVNAADRDLYLRELALCDEFKAKLIASLGAAMYTADGCREQESNGELESFYLEEACGLAEKLLGALSSNGLMLMACRGNPFIGEGY